MLPHQPYQAREPSSHLQKGPWILIPATQALAERIQQWKELKLQKKLLPSTILLPRSDTPAPHL
jgi:hypothetical protein